MQHSALNIFDIGPTINQTAAITIGMILNMNGRALHNGVQFNALWKHDETLYSHHTILSLHPHLIQTQPCPFLYIIDIQSLSCLPSPLPPPPPRPPSNTARRVFARVPFATRITCSNHLIFQHRVIFPNVYATLLFTLGACVAFYLHVQGLCCIPRFNKIATQGAPQMAVDKEANSLSRVYSYYSKFNPCLFYV